MEVKIIRDQIEYEKALASIAELIELDPVDSTPEAERLELLALLVQEYESTRFAVEVPNALDAIRFRMEQQALTHSDLVRFIGSRSKVSEVLSGKRPLSRSMMISLHNDLGIPAHVLLQDTAVIAPNGERPDQNDKNELDTQPDILWTQYPLKEMIDRGYFDDLEGIENLKQHKCEIDQQASYLMTEFMRPLNLNGPIAIPMLNKQTTTDRAKRLIDSPSLSAWAMRVLRLAAENPPYVTYERGAISQEFLFEVARLSWLEQGPLLAQEFLHKHGISLVIEPHLPRTHLDGAAIWFWQERPVIGMTLRHDRLDNFWFCLLHELAHIWLHFRDPEGKFVGGLFYDDFDPSANASGSTVNSFQDVENKEREANDMARTTLVPDAIWQISPVRQAPTPTSAKRLADELRVNPAVVAGRVRHHYKSYHLLKNLIGQGQVRRLFPQVKWPTVEKKRM